VPFRKPAGRGHGVRGIALVGFMGAGKTTVGRALAARLGWPFLDLDEILVARFGPIADQVARDGLGSFREREAGLVRELCDGAPRVLAAGGGTFADPASRDALRASYRTIWLDATLPELSTRLGPGRDVRCGTTAAPSATRSAGPRTRWPRRGSTPPDGLRTRSWTR
jgi:shikimate kinase / 3-dehydroquinate synthase